MTTPDAKTNGQAGSKLLSVLVFTLILSVMNATMFNIALPSISQQFQLTPSQVSWIVTGYIIVYAIGSVTYGKLADKYRLKDLLTFGLIFFAAGSIIGLAAQSFAMIMIGRILQSVGASVIPATAMLIPVRYFPPEQRGRALGTTSSGIALGTAIGPIVSGFIISFASWRFLFCLSLLALLTLPFYRKYLDDAKGQAGKTDLLGGALLAGTISLLLLAVTQSSFLYLLAGLVVLILFVIRVRTADEPFIQPKLFLNKQYTWGIIIAFFSTGLSFGIPFITPLMLTGLNQMTPAAIGFVMFPGALAAAIMGRTGGKLVDEKGSAFLGYIALSSLLLSFFFLSVTAGLSPYLIALFLLFGNIGQTFMQITISSLISRSLSREQAGVGMGLMMMINFISGAAATTFIGKVMDTGTADFTLNPLLVDNGAALYSNIFTVLTAAIVMVAFVFHFKFAAAEKAAVLRG
ncbi:MFS transporter [Paenibacillus turpanensis]|uniref:MFS transporter n=1 Tax=Paenibacillus turpanensis TaxID=2689078 RepID=UPI001407C61E|nr:MFS transporter [Paenibacillus turpanensis]